MTDHGKRGWLLAACAILGVTVAAQTPAPEEKKPAPPPLVIPVSQLKPEASIDLAAPHVLAVADDSVWAINRAAGTVARIDPKTNAVVQTTAAGTQPCAGVVNGFGSLWVPLCGGGVARIDLKTNAVTTTVKTPVGDVSRGVVSANNSVWLLTDAKGTMTRIDPATNEAVAEIYLAPGTTTLAFGQGALWALSPAKNTLTRVDPFTNLVVETIAVGKSPVAVAIGEGAVWVLNQGDGSVSRVDSKTNKVTETIPVGPLGLPAELAAGEGSIWISAPGSPLIRIDPRTHHVAQRFTGPGGGSVVVGHGAVWLGATPAAIWRVDPKRAEATR
jgi:YVTN family beta-propeller protein